jgi:hypothetical protein
VNKALVAHTLGVLEGVAIGIDSKNIKMDIMNPEIIRLLNAIPEEYRERGHQAIIDEIQTLVDLEVVEWAPLPAG